MVSAMGKMLAALAVMTAAAGCTSAPQPPAQLAYSPHLSPSAVVELYFRGWAAQDYEVMYATVSDGFKTIESTAQTLETFTQQMSRFYESARSVKLISVKEMLNDGTTASVDYTIEIEKLDGTKTPFSSTYTLKYRTNDTVPGWKLIHPYGKNVDTS